LTDDWCKSFCVTDNQANRSLDLIITSLMEEGTFLRQLSVLIMVDIVTITYVMDKSEVVPWQRAAAAAG